MVFDVVEENESWWVRLSRGHVWIGPFAEHADAVTWARGFVGEDQDIAALRRQTKRQRLRIVGGEAA